MTSKAYILIKTKAQKTFHVLEKILESHKVQFADIVTGPHDLIVLIEAPTANALLDFIIQDLRHIEGITDTTTCFVVQQEGKHNYETNTEK